MRMGNGFWYIVFLANKDKNQHHHQKNQKNMQFRIKVKFKIIPYVLENEHLQAKYLE